jgi:hypothetical protein
LEAINIACEFGRSDVDAFLGELSADQYDELRVWKAQHRDHDADVRAALICRSMSGGKLSDYLPQKPSDAQPQTEDQAKAMLLAVRK